MGYLIQQMWFCLLLAAILGAVIGWLLKRLFCRGELDDLDSSWRSKLDRVESERDDLRSQLSSAAAPVSAVAAAPAAAVATAEPVAVTPSKPTSYPVEEVEGIGKSYGKSIREMGITTTLELLDKCCLMDGRIQVAEKVGIEDFVVHKWASMCDLMRVSGVGGQFAELMVYAGIDSAQDLAQQDAGRLHDILAKAN
ncbi:MAG: DUF4332 domain-containing protein, partial [Gammaproteobacteria bacterium]